MRAESSIENGQELAEQSEDKILPPPPPPNSWIIAETRPELRCLWGRKRSRAGGAVLTASRLSWSAHQHVAGSVDEVRLKRRNDE